MAFLKSFAARLWTNWITLSGAVLTTFGALGGLAVAVTGVAGLTPYLSALLLAVLPTMFTVGLLLIPIGLWWQRRRKTASSETASAIAIALANPQVAGAVTFLLLATGVNMIVLLVVGQKTVHHFSSNAFCGTTCHTPMEPEWTAYGQSAHAQVACVACHVGEGVGANVEAKMNGVHQLVGVITGNYGRPVPPPTEHMRGAASRCVTCHSPNKHYGDKVRLFAHFKDDDKSTPVYNALSMSIGGRNPITKAVTGIHAHADPAKRIEYATAREGGEVREIKVYENEKLVVSYAREGDKKETTAARKMDCLDCHNRPAHTFARDAGSAVESALYEGALDPSLPFARKKAVEILTAATPSRDSAPAYFTAAVQKAYPEEAKANPEVIAKTGKALSDLYLRNIFPDMSVKWGTYRSQLGHVDDASGCFRCHNSDFKATEVVADRKARLGKKCDSCHTTLANEANPDDFDDTLAAMFVRQ